MRTAFVFFALVLLAAASTIQAQDLPILTVEDIGTPLDIPDFSVYNVPGQWGSFVVSPDGQWMAYAPGGGLGERSDIYLKPVAGGEATRIFYYDQFAEQFKGDPKYTGFPNWVRSITFTPDSREITFEIEICYAELGCEIEFKYDENGYWDGMSGGGGIPCIWSIDIDNGDIREILTGGRYPLWDPTGRYLLYQNFDCRAYMEGGEPENHRVPMVLDTLTWEFWVPNDKIYWYQTISTDGQHILFYSGRSGEEYVRSDGADCLSYQIFRCPLAGGDIEQITHLSDDIFSAASPVISPDGEWMFFSELTDQYYQVNFELDKDWLTTGTWKTVASGLSVLNMETGEYFELVPPNYNLHINPLCISPDGGTLYARVIDSYIEHTYVMGDDGKYYLPRNRWIVTIPIDPDTFGEPFITAVESGSPESFPTISNYPNPFNASTTISFTLPKAGFTELAVYNLTGQKIRTLLAGELSSGLHEVVWDGCDDAGNPVSSGIFITRLSTGDAVETNRMTLVK